MNNNIIYVAIDKETKKVVVGAKGQNAFADTGTLRRSIGQTQLQYRAREEGKKPSDYYNIHQINLEEVLKLT